MNIRVHDDPLAAATDAAQLIARRVRAAVVKRSTASLAVSGGTTPALMFDVLRTLEVPWHRLLVFQVDERVVPDGDAARNLAMLDRLPIARHNVKAMPVTSRDLRQSARRYAAGLASPLDVVHLGVGDDGHTASWAPGDPVIDERDDVGVTEPYRGTRRMTLTPPAVNHARSRLVLVTGDDKAEALSRWLLGDARVPVQRVRRSRTTLIVDRAAVALFHAAAAPRPIR